MLAAPAPAKLNQGLHVVRRRADGFHDLDTVFLRIPWCDRLRVTPANDLTMTCSDPLLPVDDRNLCVRAARLLADASGVATGARIHLEKHVPHGTGLGGGSSDAATTLRLLLRMWSIDPGSVDLSALALELGSDVPFFLGPPAARGEGRGERLTPLRLPAHLARCVVLVAVPRVRVATSRAFGLLRLSCSDRPDVASLIAGGPPVTWRGVVVNDFQDPVRRAESSVDAALRALDAADASYTSLTGSGSAVYGLFEDHVLAERARRKLDELACETWAGHLGDPPDALPPVL